MAEAKLEENKVHYAALQTPTFGVQLSKAELRAENGILAVEKEFEEELDKLIAKRADVAQNLRKIDVKAAEALAREHMAKARPVAATGTVTTPNLQGGKDAIRKAEGAQIGTQPVTTASTGAPEPVVVPEGAEVVTPPGAAEAAGETPADRAAKTSVLERLKAQSPK